MPRRSARPRLPILIALVAAGCGGTPDREVPGSIAAIDDGGHEVRLAAPAARVVSLIPAVTEIVVALGAADRLVARTDFDGDPSLAHLPSAGPGLTPSIEWLASLAPGLVIAWPDGRSRSVVRRLEELGIPVYGARIETIDDIAATIRRIGALLGLEARADSLVATLRHELDEVATSVADRLRPRVFYVVGYDPPMTAGPGTFIDEIIAIAGGRNIFDDAPGWPQVSIEEIVRRAPDVVVLPQGAGGMAPERLRHAPGWRELPAIRQGRIVTVDAELFHRPGPRAGEIAKRLAELLHRDPLLHPAAPEPAP